MAEGKPEKVRETLPKVLTEWPKRRTRHPFGARQPCLYILRSLR